MWGGGGGGLTLTSLFETFKSMPELYNLIIYYLIKPRERPHSGSV